MYEHSLFIDEKHISYYFLEDTCEHFLFIEASISKSTNLKFTPPLEAYYLNPSAGNQHLHVLCFVHPLIEMRPLKINGEEVGGGILTMNNR